MIRTGIYWRCLRVLAYVIGGAYEYWPMINERFIGYAYEYWPILLAVLTSTGLFYWRCFRVLAYGQQMYVRYDWEIVCAMHKWIDMLVKHYVWKELVISTCV